jgi:hypothetical protein
VRHNLPQLRTAAVKRLLPLKAAEDKNTYTILQQAEVAEKLARSPAVLLGQLDFEAVSQ